MTENEIKNTKEWFEDFIEAYALSNQETIEFKKAVACLEELQQYRAIGTVEEFKALKEKSVAKKVTDDISLFRCPSCGSGEIEEFYETGSSNKHNYCPDCGQKLDWQ